MTAPRYVAAVDCGSHTFCAVVARSHGADAGFRVIDVVKERVALTHGLDTEEGTLERPTIDRALAVLRRFGERLRGMDPKDVRVVGTSALRVAAQGALFRQAAERALGFPVEVIDGHEEALLVYLGVAHGGVPRRRRLVMDIGGGSTEIAVGEELEPDTTHSEPFGHLERSQRLGGQGRFDEERFWTVRSETLARWGEVRDELEPSFEEVFGTGGTARAVAKVLEATGRAPRHVPFDALQDLEAELATRGHDEDLSLPGLSPRRAATFAGGVIDLSAFMEAFEIERLLISPRGVREGILHVLLGHERDVDLRERSIVRLERRYGVDPAQGRRVAETALALASDDLGDEARRLLSFAARLHEMGQALKHDGYHKEGARILRRTALEGFSGSSQMALAALVRLHRPGSKLKGKHLRRIADKELRDEMRRAVLCLRLAVLMRRSRLDETISPRLENDGDEVTLHLPAAWLDEHPLLVADLDAETRRWGGRRLSLHTVFHD